MSSHTEACYNKFTAQGKGTLIGNWAEERSLREFTGVGRTIVKEHIPKRHLNFEEAIKGTDSYDDTRDRIYGERQFKIPFTETSTVGAGYNPADNLARCGRKQELMEADILDKVRAEFEAKDKEYAKACEQRMFETTNMAVHH